MSENIDWSFVLTAAGFAISVIGLLLGGKKIVQNISPRTKTGNIDMSKGEFIIKKEVNKYKEPKGKRKE